MITEQKIRPGLLAGLFLLAALVMLVFHTRPAISERGAVAEKVAGLQRDIETLKQGKLPDEENAVQISEVERKDLEKAIPRDMAQDAIITDLNRIAELGKVTFNGLTFSVQSSGDVSAVSVSAGFLGTPADMVRFLKLLEVNPRKFVVKTISIARSSDSGSAALDLVNLTLTLQAYYSPRGLVQPSLQ